MATWQPPVPEQPPPPQPTKIEPGSAVAVRLTCVAVQVAGRACCAAAQASRGARHRSFADPRIDHAQRVGTRDVGVDEHRLLFSISTPCGTPSTISGLKRLLATSATNNRARIEPAVSMSTPMYSPAEIGRLAGKAVTPAPLVVCSALLAVEVKVPPPLSRMTRSLKLATVVAFTRHLVTAPLQGVASSVQARRRRPDRCRRGCSPRQMCCWCLRRWRRPVTGAPAAGGESVSALSRATRPVAEPILCATSLQSNLLSGLA